MEQNNVMTDEERKRLIDSIPRITDTDACKENIQPRRLGRSVSALATLFETTSTEREAMLEAEHIKFQEQLEDIDEQDDPLQSYVDYIKWTIQMYPQGQSVESNLLGLLKDATNQFKNDRRYKFDARYLKIWIEYASLVNEPKEIFLYLMKQGIGQTLSLFYEEYASYYEKLNKFDEATQVYELGIKENADPIKRLKKNFDLFKARVQERKNRGLIKKPKSHAQTQMESLRATGQRVMLGEKFDSRSRSSFASNVFAGIESRFGSSSSSSSTQLQRHKTFGNDRPSTSTDPSFTIYVEPPTTKSSILPSSSSISSTNSIPSSSSTRENERPVEKFAGATLPQNAALIPKSKVEKFEIYVDPEEENEEAPRKFTLDRTSSMLSIISTDSESPMSRIRKNPLSDEQMMVKRARTNESFKKLEARFRTNKHRFIERLTTEGTIQYICMFKDHDETVSFEELRAQSRSRTAARAAQEQGNDFTSYINEENAIHEEVKAMPDLTTETLAAKKTIDELFHSNSNYTQDEEDLTWNNTYQNFEPIVRPTIDENEE